MNLVQIESVLQSSGVQLALVLLAAFLAGGVAFSLASSVTLEQSTSRRLGRFAGTVPTGIMEEVGGTVLRFWRPGIGGLAGSLDWAQLGGHFEGWTIATLIGRCAIFAGGTVLLVFFISSDLLISLIIGALAGAYPVIQVNGRAGDVKKQIGREVPEMAALVAAELAAGNPPDMAVERASKVPGPLGRLLSRALAESRSSGRPLFTRKPVRGTLVELLLGSGLSELTAFGAQLDLVAAKGVAGADLMADISRAISREYFEHVMSAAESLESQLVLPSAIFFFLPFTIAILLPIMTALSGAF